MSTEGVDGSGGFNIWEILQKLGAAAKKSEEEMKAIANKIDSVQEGAGTTELNNELKMAAQSWQSWQDVQNFVTDKFTQGTAFK